MSTPIVASAHLVSEHAAELSEYEYGLYVASNAFNRWISHCMAAAGGGNMPALEVMVVHTVNHRDRKKRLADLCLTLNVDDSHTINYALKKLMGAGLVVREKQGKEWYYTTSDRGRDLCLAYREVRENCLIDTVNALGAVDTSEVHETAKVLRALSGLYDQAARAATNL